MDRNAIVIYVVTCTAIFVVGLIGGVSAGLQLAVSWGFCQ